jgi:cytochrome c5
MSNTAKWRRFAISLLGLLTGAGCSGETHEEIGEPTGATCPADSSLTYDTFAGDFMTSYCTECHSLSVRGRDRQGAPSDHNFDSLPALRAVGAEHLDLHAAAGPNHVNEVMPPEGHDPRPSEAERRQLGEWLACGLR